MAWKFKNKQLNVTSDFNINTNKLINIVDPTDNQDGATKGYVDTAILESGSTTTWYLRDSSDTTASVSNDKYLKFTQSTTINTVFGNSTSGTTGDPYTISLSVIGNSISATQLNVSGDGDSGQLLSSNGSGGFSWIDNSPDGVTSVTAGDGMVFTEITDTGVVTMGTPSDITSGSTNSVTTTSHTHVIDSVSLVSGTEGILVNNDNQFILDNTYVIETIIPGLTQITGVTSDQSLGAISSGITLGMIYIENTGTTTAYINLGVTTTGNEINPYSEVVIGVGDLISITVNERLSNTQTETMYISSSSWTDVDLNVEWAEITYKNQSNEIDPSTLPIATALRLGGVKIGTNINVTGDGIISVDDPIVSLSGLTDTVINSPTNDQTLVYDNGDWVNGDAVSSISGLTDTDINNPQEDQSLVYSGGTWVNGTGSGGGFLGNITKDSTEPTNLQGNQWVKPEPQSNGTFNYVFDNFDDISSTAIGVNLSLEDVILRYDADGYWIKESYNKPLTSGKTWVGTTNNEVQEMAVVEEWVTTEAGLTYIGQKFAYDTQTIFKTDFDQLTILPNVFLIEDINLKIATIIKIADVPSGKKLLFNRLKLIILGDATPTSFTISIGNNSGTYDNIVGSTSIDDDLTNETYDLQIGGITYPRQSTSITTSTVYFRIISASTHANALTAHLLVEGLVY